MKKNKITIPISLGLVALILTALIFTQIKTVDETDITAIETMRETELRTELANWKEKYEEIETEISEKDSRINEYKEELNNNADSSSLLENEVKEAETYLGYTDVQGEGIIVTLSDKDIYNVEYDEILQLVNELKAAGAEAISINGERIVSSSDIVLINNRIILVNSVKITGPYVVKAIGNQKYLESALTIKGGYVDEIMAKGIDISYTVENSIIITGHDSNLDYKYAQEYKEEE